MQLKNKTKAKLRSEVQELRVQVNKPKASGPKAKQAGDRVPVPTGLMDIIPERKLSENELLEKTRLTKVLLDNMPCVAFLLRSETRKIVASNKIAAEAGAVPGQEIRFEYPGIGFQKFHEHLGLRVEYVVAIRCVVDPQYQQ